MRKVYGLDLSYWKAHRAKRKALEMLRGDPTDSYARLPSYLYMLKHSNPGSVVSLHKTDESHFMYAFAALNSSIQDWKYCRPVVVVDGSFLKACYRGIFLTASCQDAAENNASWEWFFNRLKKTIGERDKMCFVSDRHKSTTRAISVVYPEVPHCACMWHLWNNIKDNFRRNQLVLKDIFYAMARAYTVQEFDYYMTEVEQIDKRVKKYLLNIGYEKWARAHLAVNKTMTMNSNVVESLNSATKSARELPVMKLFDEMRKLVEKWSYTNMKEAQGKLTALTKTYEDILAEKLSEGQHMTARPSSDYLHTVIFMGRTFIVDIKERTCTCRRFQLDELPCAQALAVLSSKGLHGED